MRGVRVENTGWSILGLVGSGKDMPLCSMKNEWDASVELQAGASHDNSTFFRKCPLVRDGVEDGRGGGEGEGCGYKRVTGGIPAMTEMFCALTVSRSTS